MHEVPVCGSIAVNDEPSAPIQAEGHNGYGNVGMVDQGDAALFRRGAGASIPRATSHSTLCECARPVFGPGLVLSKSISSGIWPLE
jgi:hypothetical protein